ncbi:hypothetical protein K2173_025746 [Erythroxylum novogranatense]|uniref:Secreted protein n=1 Tax=Erythroxylum novogranatense TaxID=1862640 RepID=A0AAV8T4J3_9ROSI|nr:hypothetical protein K2173_025746 [Erythroxylum novogranatense]
MVRKATLLIALTWLLVVASISISASATAGARMKLTEDLVYPQAGCRCCYFVGKIPNLRCGKVCCNTNMSDLLYSKDNQIAKAKEQALSRKDILDKEKEWKCTSEEEK